MFKNCILNTSRPQAIGHRGAQRPGFQEGAFGRWREIHGDSSEGAKDRRVDASSRRRFLQADIVFLWFIIVFVLNESLILNLIESATAES